ncbi:hypothetical protein WCP94_003185 [Bilophila wadsworthia]
MGHHEMPLCVLSFTMRVSATIAYATKRKKKPVMKNDELFCCFILY